MGGFLLIDFVWRFWNFLVLISTSLILSFVDLYLLVVVERSKVFVICVFIFIFVLRIPRRLRLWVASSDVVPAIVNFSGWSRLSLNRSTCWLILGSAEVFTSISFLGPARRRIIMLCCSHRKDNTRSFLVISNAAGICVMIVVFGTLAAMRIQPGSVRHHWLRKLTLPFMNHIQR